MTARSLVRTVLRYGFAVTLREWVGCSRIDPKVRVGVGAAVVVAAIPVAFIVLRDPAHTSDHDAVNVQRYLPAAANEA